MVMDNGTIPEFYADQFAFRGSAYTVHLTFSVGAPTGQPKELVSVRMSPLHAKVMAIVFKKAMKDYEAALGAEIAVPPGLLEEQHISLDSDW